MWASSLLAAASGLFSSPLCRGIWEITSQDEPMWNQNMAGSLPVALAAFSYFEIREQELFTDLGRVCQGQWGVITDVGESAGNMRGLPHTLTYSFFK